jgi:hypothetical protein
VFRGGGAEYLAGGKERISCFFSGDVCGITPLIFVGCMPGDWGVEINVHEQMMTTS